MTRIVHAELLRLVRARTVLAAVLGAVAFAGVATVAIFAAAEDTAARSRRGGTPLAELAGTGGGTEAFAVGASFVGFLVFVTIIALVASELTGGTFRSLLLREPRRGRLVVGKLAGTLLVAGGVVAVAEVLTFVASLIVAPTRDVATGEWLSSSSLGAAGGDYLSVMAGVAGWAVFATALALVFRSTPIALAVGFAWAGPFENIVVDSWSAGYRWFPGQVLASMIQGGTVELGFGRAALTAAAYAAVAGAGALTLVTRRDVTA